MAKPNSKKYPNTNHPNVRDFVKENCFPNKSETIKKIAGHLTEARQEAEKLYGANYPEQVRIYKNLIGSFSRRHKIEVLEALTVFLSDSSVQESTELSMLIKAAAYDLIIEQNK